VFTANTEDRIIPETYRQYIDNFITLNTNNLDALRAEATKLNATQKIEAIIPGSEYHVSLTAHLANNLGLVGHPIKTVEALRNKYALRDILSQRGVSTPKYALLNSTNDLRAAAEKTGFPAVLKPTQMAGGLNVRRVNNFADLTTAYLEITQHSAEEMGHSTRNGVILESYIPGEIFSVEGFISRDRLTVTSITKKFMCHEPFFVEMGHIVQANLEDAERRAIIEYVEKIFRALEINVGVFHLELKVDQGKPMLIEVAGRLPGDHIVELVQCATGVNLVTAMIQSHLAQPVSETVTRKKYAGIQYFSLPANVDSYSEIEGFDQLNTLPGFVEAQRTVLPNTTIRNPETFNGRVAYVIISGDSYDEVYQALARARDIVNVKSLHILGRARHVSCAL
jgi:biotin carboxylase